MCEKALAFSHISGSTHFRRNPGHSVSLEPIANRYKKKYCAIASNFAFIFRLSG
jgi:hypothetical protein